MTRRILAATLAVVLAMVAAMAVLFYARTADRRALAGQEAVSVYIAAKLVPAGTTAQQAEDNGLIEKELVAAKAVPDGALTRIGERTRGLKATSDIVPGELVLAERFAEEVPTQGRLVVPEGKLAVTVELPDPAKVGQFLVVGSRITVFDTFNVQFADTEDITPSGDHISDDYAKTRATRVLLPNIEVLAVGQTTTKPVAAQQVSDSGEEKNNQPVSAAMALVTVAVTQAEAEKLVHGVQVGTLYLGLLGDDTEVTVTKGVDDRRLFQEVAK